MNYNELKKKITPAILKKAEAVYQRRYPQDKITMCDDGDMIRVDVDGRELHHPLAGGIFVDGRSDRQISGTCDSVSEVEILVREGGLK